MAAVIGTLKVPARIVITAGEKLSHKIGFAEFDLEIEVTGGTPTSDSHVMVTPDGRLLRSSMARALREAADDIEAQHE